MKVIDWNGTYSQEAVRLDRLADELGRKAERMAHEDGFSDEEYELAEEAAMRASLALLWQIFDEARDDDDQRVAQTLIAELKDALREYRLDR